MEILLKIDIDGDDINITQKCSKELILWDAIEAIQTLMKSIETAARDYAQGDAKKLETATMGDLFTRDKDITLIKPNKT